MSSTRKSATPYRAGLMPAGDKGKLDKLQVLQDGSLEAQEAIRLAKEPQNLKDIASVSYANRTSGLEATAGMKPTLDLDFAGMAAPLSPTGVDWSQYMPFERISNATRVDTVGSLADVAIDTPRINHTFNDGQNIGLLIEGQKTNLCLRSYDLGRNNVPWGQFNGLTAEALAETAPDGTLTAAKLTSSGSDLNSRLQQSVIGLEADTDYVFSVYVKLAPNSPNQKFRMDLFMEGGPGAASIPAGKTTTASETFTATEEWQRFSVTAYSGDNTTARFCAARETSAGQFIVFGWGGQLEKGTSPTSVIKTLDSAVTVAADKVFFPTSNHFIKNEEGSFYTEVYLDQQRDFHGIFWLNPDTVNYRGLGLNLFSENEKLYAKFTTRDDVQNIQCQSANNSLKMNAVNKIACSYGPNGIALSVNGQVVVHQPTYILNQYKDFTVGYSNIETIRDFANASIERLSYFPQQLSHVILQELTK